MMSLREKELRSSLKAIFGNSCYADETIEVIVNCQLNKWSEEDMEKYRQQKKEDFEKALEQMGETLPLEQQTFYRLGEMYGDNTNDGTNCETGKTRIEDAGIQRVNQLCGDENTVSINEKQ